MSAPPKYQGVPPRVLYWLDGKSLVNGSLHVEPTWAYQAQFQWHDGEGRLTLVLVSNRTGDGSHRCSIFHPFAYHGLPYILQPFFKELKTYRRDGHIAPTYRRDPV
jgi:hypothetical protein